MSFVIIDNVGYEQESKTLFSNMSANPDSARKRIINNLIKQLKGDGQWNLLDVVWMFSAHDQQSSRLNWKSPGNFTLTEVNSPTWTKDRGYTGNGTTMYLNSNFNASTQGVNYILNSASFGLYRRSANVQENNFHGSNTAASVALGFRERSTVDTMVGRLHNTTNLTVTSTNSQGLFAVVRTSATNTQFYRNGSTFGAADATASSSIPSMVNYLMALNNNGTTASWSAGQYSCAFFGSGTINQLLLYNAIQTFMTSLQAQV